LGPHAGVTYLVDCLKNVKVYPSYVYYPLEILSVVVPTGSTIVFSCGKEVLFVIQYFCDF